MPPKSMSQDSINKLFEDVFENRVRELEKAKGKGKEGECDSDEEEEQGGEEETPRQEVELPVDQREFFEVLKSIGRESSLGKDDIPRFSGKMNVEEVMDWIEALNNHFECKETLENKKVIFAKSKMKGEVLTW